MSSKAITEPLRWINALLPLVAPEPCPICGAKVYITGVNCWESDTGKILEFDYNCETEPDIDSDEWQDWFTGHWRNMPYVHWLPWEIRCDQWLAERYRYDGSAVGREAER